MVAVEPRETVRDWLRSNGETAKPSTSFDSRVKVSPKANPQILERVESGESQEQVAADYGVTQRTVSSIVTKEKKQREAKKEREKAVAVAE